MEAKNCKVCGSSKLRPMSMSEIGAKWVCCDVCGNHSDPLVTNDRLELITQWNSEQETNT